ncbi:MAG: polysaccharide deacetylase family protein, partial [Dokdonella sp.]
MAATLLHGSGLIRVLASLRTVLTRDLRILAYHRIVSLEKRPQFAFDLDLISASESQFREQVRLLKRHFDPIRFADVIDAFENGTTLPKRPVIVSFDDGYDDNYTSAYPILRELGVPATFFVSTGHIDSGCAYAYDWLVHMICRTPSDRLHIVELGIDQPIPGSLVLRRTLASEVLDRIKALGAKAQRDIVERLESEWSMPSAAGHADCRPMNWNQLREMHANGMEVGSHGVWHNMLAKLSGEEMAEEIHASKRTLDRELGAPVEVISYPVGGHHAYNAEVIAAVRNAGFKLGCSYISG